MNKIFFTADLHFGHKNIIRYDNRPFFTVSEMDVALIDKWNAKVTEEDTVYILGDISWYDDNKTVEILNKLNGHKILIRGNHDSKSKLFNSCFDKVMDYCEITIQGQKKIVLCHYPIVFFNGHHYGTYMFYGHVHTTHEWQMTQNYKHEIEQLDIKCNMYNVGCMIWNYEPVTFEEIVGKIKNL